MDIHSHIIGAHVPLLFYVTVQPANYVTLAQGIKLHRYKSRASVEIYILPQVLPQYYLQYYLQFGEPVPNIDSCFWLTGVEHNVVSCYCSLSSSGFDMYILTCFYGWQEWLFQLL